MDLIRVSEVLSPYQDFSKVPDRFMEPALDRGSAVHLFACNYAKNLWAPIPKEYEGYCLSFKNWFDKYVEKVFMIEERLDDKELGYTGQPDLVCNLLDDPIPLVVDYKTSAITQRIWISQVCAYIELARKYGIPVKRGGALKLNADGKTAKFVPIDFTGEAFSAFLSALNAYRWLKG